MSFYGFNQEGSPDPTVAMAVANVTEAEKKYRPFYMKEETERDLTMFMDLVIPVNVMSCGCLETKRQQVCAWRLQRQRSTVRKSDILAVSAEKQTELWILDQRKCRRNVK